MTQPEPDQAKTQRIKFTDPETELNYQKEE